MATQIRVVGQRFLAKLNNGDSFTTNDTTDFAQHLKGGVLEEMKAIFNVQISWQVGINEYTYVYDKTANTFSIDPDGLDWINKGFAIGDNVKFSIESTQTSPTKAQITGDVTSITGSEMILSNVIETQDSLQGGVVFISGQADDYVVGLTKKTALKYDFGLIENDDQINFLSKLTNTTQTYLFEGIDHNAVPLTWVDGITAGNNKAAYTGSARLGFVGYSKDRDYIYNENTVQEFQIEHIFTINPIYRDGELDSLKGIDVPPLDIFNGNASLKYVFQTEFRTVLNNPNTSMISDYDTQLGSVGYLDESYNGYANVYSTESLVYTVDSSTADQIEVGSVTNVAFTLKSSNSTFTSSTPVVVGHTAVVDSDEYSNNADSYDDVWTNKTLRAVTGDAPTTDGLIKNYTATFVDADTIDITFDIEFTGAQKSLLQTNQDYLLYYTVQDPTKTVDTGDKVTGRIDVNFYYKNNDVQGLFEFDKFEQYPHPEEFNSSSIGFTEALTFNESGMMADGRFWVLNTATLNSLKFDIVVRQFEDNTWDSLRSLDIDLSDQVIVGGVQQIELDSTRGYLMIDEDIFNYLKITTSTNDGTKQYYDIQVGYKIPWQPWLEFKDAPSDFYNKEKSFNGLNQKASNYSMAGSGPNTFLDAVGGTFEDTVTANWNLTSLGYSPGTPNQVGSSFQSRDYGFNSDISGFSGWSGPSMNEASNIYSLFKNDTTIDVVEGEYYEIISYIAIKNTFEQSHLDNGLFFWLPTGYTKAECENIKGFFVTNDNIYFTDEPIQSDWKQIKTYFKAKTTESLTFTFSEELTTANIPTGTGGNYGIDGITVKKVEYGINVLFDAVVDSTNYVTSSEEIKVFDYEEDDQAPTNFTCEIKTYNKDGTEIAGNVIKEDYTELKAIFTPLVAPTFTESVDMTEVATDWSRFGHGNKLLSPATSSERKPNWTNEQADDFDTFEAFGGSPSATKNDVGLYTSTTNSILTTQNMFAVYGCYSLDQYEYYSISGEMYSNDASDNDSLIYTVAFFVDEFGIENSLTLCATTGGVLHDINPNYIPNSDQSSTIVVGGSPYPAGWDLVYNFGKADCRNLIHFETTKSGFDWGDSQVGDLMFNVNRSSDDITIDVDWTIDTEQFVNTFNFDLTSDTDTVKFRGYQNIGFAFMSQSQGGFKNVVLTKPEGDFYAKIRIDNKESQSDFSVNEISTLIETPADSLLKQITGDFRTATLSYDGTSFIAQCLIDTSNFEKGQEYDLSTELRPINLEKI